MRTHCTICVGTMGSGIWRSPDGGGTWTRLRPSRSPESDVRALAVHPRKPDLVYAGTDSGVYRSEDRGASWGRLDSPMNSRHRITTLAEGLGMGVIGIRSRQLRQSASRYSRGCQTGLSLPLAGRNRISTRLSSAAAMRLSIASECPS